MRARAWPALLAWATACGGSAASVGSPSSNGSGGSNARVVSDARASDAFTEALDAAVVEEATLDAAVTSDGSACDPGQIVCPVPCCYGGCAGETECSAGPACLPPPECPK